MAGYRQHLAVSGLCGGAYAALTTVGLGLSPVQGLVAGGLTWLGGLWPDLDSRSGRPVRELTSVLAAVVPVIATFRIRRFAGAEWFDADRAVLVAMVGYVVVRYGGAALLGRLSVHRGMFHSLPALIIAAEITWLLYPNTDWPVRLVMAGGTAIGFFSHLVLDEAYSVKWDGVTPRLKSSSGTALKWAGKDWRANAFCYGLLATLTAGVWGQAFPDGPGRPVRPVRTGELIADETEETPEPEITAVDPRDPPASPTAVDRPADPPAPKTVGEPDEDVAERPPVRTADGDGFGPRPGLR